MARREVGVVWDRNKVVLIYTAVMVTICVGILIYQMIWG